MTSIGDDAERVMRCVDDQWRARRELADRVGLPDSRTMDALKYLKRLGKVESKAFLGWRRTEAAR